jgi:hypothetical protein
MAGEVLRRNIFAIFELCASHENLWLKIRHYAKPQNVGGKLKDRHHL